MNTERLRQERLRAVAHDVRHTILELLDGRGLTLSDLATTMPDAAARVLPPASPEAVIAYHLRVLNGAEMVGCEDGIYRTAG